MLVRLRICADSPDPSLPDNPISNILRAGSNIYFNINFDSYSESTKTKLAMTKTKRHLVVYKVFMSRYGQYMCYFHMLCHVFLSSKSTGTFVMCSHLNQLYIRCGLHSVVIVFVN